MMNEKSNGFICRECGGSIFYTTHTHRREGKIIRRKVCKECGMKIVSCEKIIKFCG